MFAINWSCICGKLSSVSGDPFNELLFIFKPQRWELTVEESSPKFSSLLLGWKYHWIWWKFSLWLGLRIQVLKPLEGNKLNAVSDYYFEYTCMRLLEVIDYVILNFWFQNASNKIEIQWWNLLFSFLNNAVEEVSFTMQDTIYC